MARIGHRRGSSRRRLGERFIMIGELYRVNAQRVLLSGKSVPEIGEKVYDSRLKEVGYVSDVFGPVDGFYIAVKRVKQGEEIVLGEKERFYVLRVDDYSRAT